MGKPTKQKEVYPCDGFRQCLIYLDGGIVGCEYCPDHLERIKESNIKINKTLGVQDSKPFKRRVER